MKLSHLSYYIINPKLTWLNPYFFCLKNKNILYNSPHLNRFLLNYTNISKWMLINLILNILISAISLFLQLFGEKKTEGKIKDILYAFKTKNAFIQYITMIPEAISQHSLHILFISLYMPKHPFENNQSTRIIIGFKYLNSSVNKTVQQCRGHLGLLIFNLF